MVENHLLFYTKELFYLLSKLYIEEKNSDFLSCQKNLITILDKIKIDFQSSALLYEDIDKLHYLLCVVGDEFVFKYTTGFTAASKSLANKYYQDANGGEKFYLYLNQWLLDRKKFIDFIEICYLCLTIGFQGKYAVVDDVEHILKLKCDELNEIINSEKKYAPLKAFELSDFRKKIVKPRKNSLILLAFIATFIGAFSVYSFILDKNMHSLQTTVTSVVNSGFFTNEN